MTKKSERQAAERQSIRAVREADIVAAITQFDADIEEAEQIADPAERILKLGEIGQNITNANKEISNAYTSEENAIFASRTAVYAGPLGGFMAHRREASVKNKLEAEVKDHLQEMTDQYNRLISQRKRADESINAAAENNVIEISRSSSCEQVLKVFGVTAIFARAAARQIVIYEARLSGAAPPQDEAAERKRSQASGIRLIRPA